MQKILVIQTAFIGDVVLATAVVEKLARYFPDAQIDFLLRKGNESLLNNNPHLHKILVWNKKENKRQNLFAIIKQVRRNRYDKVINMQRFFATGLISVLSGANETIGFDKNPLSFLFSKKVKHIVSTHRPYKHEVERNNDLVKDLTDDVFSYPRLYPSENDLAAVQPLITERYVTMSPSSVWFTKKYPFEKWVDLLNAFPPGYRVYLLGGKEDIAECEKLVSLTVNKNVEVMAGRLGFLQSAALMKTALMNYVNDSAPLHFTSAVNAPVTAIFCSTVQSFGFTPLSEKAFVVETLEDLPCRPCGLHGKKACPLQHFKCGRNIDTAQLLATLTS